MWRHLTAKLRLAHHAEGQFNPNPVKKKSLLILDASEHVDSGNMKFKIGRRISFYQFYSKRDVTSTRGSASQISANHYPTTLHCQNIYFLNN
jgi:hypothetical protein